MKDFKVCKGINKAHGSDACGNMVPTKRRKFGLCPVCYFDWMKNTEAGKIHYQKQFLPKAKATTEKRKKERTKRQKDEMTNWRVRLQSKIQEIARLIDIGQPCLARNYHANQIHGGHVYSKGGNPSMALNLHNVHRQAAQSNTYNNDDGLMRDGLKREYGQAYFEFVEGLKSTPALHYSNLQYKGFYKKACEIANALKRDGATFDRNQRLGNRNRINLELGIYGPVHCSFDNLFEI